VHVKPLKLTDDKSRYVPSAAPITYFSSKHLTNGAKLTQVRDGDYKPDTFLIDLAAAKEREKELKTQRSPVVGGARQTRAKTKVIVSEESASADSDYLEEVPTKAAKKDKKSKDRTDKKKGKKDKKKGKKDKKKGKKDEQDSQSSEESGGTTKRGDDERLDPEPMKKFKSGETPTPSSSTDGFMEFQLSYYQLEAKHEMEKRHAAEKQLLFAKLGARTSK
jgi:hypothetical protein